MPRIKLAPEPVKTAHPQLVGELVQELKADKEFGQPLAVEEPYGGTDHLRVTVFWDRFDPVSDEERTRIILEAYERLDPEYTESIAVALGLTFPEAEEEWMLPYEVVPNLRPGDAVTLEKCHQAMMELGASTLRKSHGPVLRFPTGEMARRCVARLIELLPESKDVWTVAGHMRAYG